MIAEAPARDVISEGELNAVDEHQIDEEETGLICGTPRTSLRSQVLPGSCWDPTLRQASRTQALLVLLAAAAAAALGVLRAPLLIERTSGVGFDAPEDSLSVKAQAIAERHFPTLALGAGIQIIFIIRATGDTSTVLAEPVERFSASLKQACEEDPDALPWAPMLFGYYLGIPLMQVAPKDSVVRDGFVSEDSKMMIIDLLMTKEPGINGAPHDVMINGTLEHPTWKYRHNFVAALKRFIEEHPPEGFEVLLAGNPVLDVERGTDHSIEQLLKGELIVLPLAMLVFVWLVRDWRLLLIPPVSLLLTLLVAAAAVAEVARFTKVSPDVPPAMVSVTMALSLDYNLFMLSRFNENRQKYMDLQGNLDVVMSCTGHTITVSGVLIAIAFFGAMAMPEENLRNAGLCLGITTLICFTVNVALATAILTVFGKAFKGPERVVQPMPLRMMRCSTEPCSSGMSREVPEEVVAAPALAGDEVVLGQGEPPVGYHRAAVSDAEAPDAAPTTKPVRLMNANREVQPLRNGWSGLMSHVERWPRVSVALVFLMFSPLFVMLPGLRTTADMFSVLEDSMPCVQAFHAMQEEMSVGRFDPYLVVVTLRNQTDVDEPWDPNASPFSKPDAWEDMLELCDSLNFAGGVRSMLGPWYLMDDRIDAEQRSSLQHSSDPTQARLYMAMYAQQITQSAALLQVHTTMLPRGKGSSDWVQSARQVLSLWEATHPRYRAVIAGGASAALDTKLTVMDAMPIYVGTCCSGIMVVVFLMFRSLVLPVRLAFALLFTLAATFSAAIVVYQTPLLHSIWPFLAKYDGLCYEVVPMAACIVVALGLDYDIFLVSRIAENRLAGYSDRTAICRGVVRTGGIISGAGVVMALAFSGLFFSSKLMHQQFALLLVVSVLLDTFVVRTVLVPALMLSAQGWNWWPRVMPEPVLDEADSLDMDLFDRAPDTEAELTPRSARNTVQGANAAHDYEQLGPAPGVSRDPKTTDV